MNQNISNGDGTFTLDLSICIGTGGSADGFDLYFDGINILSTNVTQVTSPVGGNIANVSVNNAKKLAEKEGLILEYDGKAIDTKFYPKVLSAMLEDITNTDHVFALKLALFENKNISDSNNDDAKKRLRAAKNKLEVLKTAIEILESN